MKYFFITFIVTLAIAAAYFFSFGYWRMGENVNHELFLPNVRINPPNLIHEIKLHHPECVTRMEHSRSTMYLQKILSGVFPIKMTNEQEGVRVTVLPPLDFKLDHKGIEVRKIYYSINVLPPIEKVPQTEAETSCPRFKFFIEIYLIDNSIRPIKLYYEWEFQYNAEQKIFFPFTINKSGT